MNHVERMRAVVVVAVMVALGLSVLTPAAAEVTLVGPSGAKPQIHTSPEVMEEDRPDFAQLPALEQERERQRQRLRESVKDLAHYLEKMTGREALINHGGIAGTPPVMIYIGDRAREIFGPPEVSFPYEQGFRIVIDAGEPPGRIGLIGESDLATSYAIYELLDRLGCRWYMPSEMGEVIPRHETITLPEGDESLAPATVFRTIWYGGNDYLRRNRMGGLNLAATHALEITGIYLTAEDKAANPDFIADVNGQKNDHRLKWNNPAVADFIADRIIEKQDANPIPSYSLSPDDGATWDNSPEELALDAGDFDPSTGQVAITDRFLVMANRIAQRVAEKHPDVLLGFLAYVQYTRPPMRETVHPNLIPQVAPITYSRAHPMNMDEVPDNTDLRYIVEGWAKAAERTSWYFYAYFLAEPSAPHPMLRKWGHDVPYVLRNGNCAFWQPETLSNFEYAMHALYMANRLAWDPSLDPQAIYDEINERFYGSAAEQMAAYWDFIDRCWVETDEYSGCGFGHLRRFTPQRMAEARRLMDAALAAASTEEEKFRVTIANDSLRLLEKFIAARTDLAEGRFETVKTHADEWRELVQALSEQYEPQAAFSKTYWSPNVNLHYYDQFFRATHDDATRVATQGRILSPEPLRVWKYQTDSDPSERADQAAGPPKDEGRDVSADERVRADYDDSGWKTTDVAVETWSTLGLHSYMASMWYRTEAEVPRIEPGKKTYLWIGSTDGSVEVFVNGQRVPYLKPVLGEDNQPTGEFERQPKADGYCQPFSFDISEAVKPGEKNTIAIFATRGFLNELGTGGLLAPAVIYTDR